ncbi:FecR family protein, partial [Umezakia ovalisporum]
SRVTLNRASRLRYAAEFGGETRLVALTGEAFFDVKRNELKPFVIEARGTEVRVLGTSFNVNAATPDVTVTVATGTVRFSGKTEKNRRPAVVLAKDETATFRAERDTILKGNRANPNALAYKTRVLLFENTPLSEVVEALNHTYGANLTLARALRTCPLTATFDNEPLDTVLGVLADTYRLSIERGPDGRIAIEGDGCQ